VRVRRGEGRGGTERWVEGCGFDRVGRLGGWGMEGGKEGREEGREI